MHAAQSFENPFSLTAMRQRLPRQLHLNIAIAVAAIFVSLLVGCGGSSGSGGTTASATIDAQGGTLVGPDGVRVVIPAGALDQPTTIGIAISSAGSPGLPEDVAPGVIYEFTPHDLVFNKPVTLRMPVPDGADGSEVLIASPGGEWQAYEATVTGGFTEWQRNSFSWGLVAACAPENNPPYSSSNPDPYPCSIPHGGANASATPAEAITRREYGSFSGSLSGNAGSWEVTQAGTVHLTLNYQAAPDCENGHVKLIRWDPAAPLTTPNRVTTLFDQAVPLTQTTYTIPGVGSYVKAAGSTTIDVAFSHLDNNTLSTNGSQGTHAFGYTFSCNRPFRSAMRGGDLLTFVSSIPVPSVTHTVGGTVSGLTGTGLVLQNNGTNFTPVAADGSFTFSSSLGEGAPYNVSVLTQPDGQTCTVSNNSGTANADISNVTVNCVTTYSIGGAVSALVGTGLVLQNNGADDLAFSANGAFSFATQLAAGAAYNVTVLTQPSGSSCTVQNGTGTANATVTTVVVDCVSAGPLALVANSGTSNGVNGLSVYRVDPSTGALAFLNNVNAGNTPHAVAITPNGLYAYVTNMMGDSVSAYGIDNATGVLTPLTGRVSNNATGIAMDRLGRFIWVANYGWHTVSSFSIGANGVLAPVGSPLATLYTLPYAIAAHPTLDYVYVAYHSSSYPVSVYSVNPATGSLTLLQTLTNVVVSANGLVIDPSGRFAYVISQGGGISAFTINPGTGMLTSIGAVSSNGSTYAIAVHPNGQYVYVTDGSSSSNNVLVFAINQITGALTQSGSPYSAGNNPRGVAVNATGTHLYVTNLSGNSVSAFAIGGGGATLTSLGAAVSAGSAPEGIAVTP